MKRLIAVIIVGVCLTLFVEGVFNHTDKIEMYSLKSITEIYEKEEIFVLFAQEKCLSCNTVKNAIKKNDKRLPNEIYVIDLDTHKEKDLIDIIVKKYNIEETPTLLKIKNGEKVSSIDLKPILSDKLYIE